MSSDKPGASSGVEEVSQTLASTSIGDPTMASKNPPTSGAPEEVFVGMKIKKPVSGEEAQETFTNMMSIDAARSVNEKFSDSLGKFIKIIVEDIAPTADMWEAMLGYNNGFDPIYFRNKMVEMLSIEEITLCVKTFLERGNNLAKIMQEPRYQKLKLIASKIGLKNHFEFKSQSPDLAKLALTFPDVAASILMSHQDLSNPFKMVPLSTLKDMLNVDEFPAICRRPTLCCLIPRNASFVNQVMDLFIFAKLANPGMKNKEEAITNQRNSLNIKLFNDAQRVGFCKLFGITTETGELSPIWSTAAAKAKEYLEANYGKRLFFF